MKSIHKLNFFATCFLILSACLVNPFAGEAHSNKNIKGQIHGIVKDTNGNPIPGVNVGLPQLGRGTSTNANGSYMIKNVPSGTYTMSFSFIGYTTKTQRITIQDNQTKVLNVILKQQSLAITAITVTGSAYVSDPLTTPADVDVIGGRKKFTDQKTSLGATLDDLAGVSTISTGSEIGKPVIHGLSGSRIRVLNDGVAMDYNQFGVRHGPNVDPFLAKRIEVVRGAASVQYGSDALGGAVNVISNSVPDARDSKSFLNGQILSAYSTNNREITGGLHLEGATGGFGLTGTIIGRSAGDIHTGPAPTFKESGVATDPKFTGKLNNTDFDQLNGSLGVGYAGNFGYVNAKYTRWQNQHNFLLPNGKGLGQNLENNALKVDANLPLGNSFILKPSFTYNDNLRQSNAGGGNAEPRSAIPKNGPAFLDLLIDSYTSKLDIEHPSVGPFSGTIGTEYLHEDQHTRGTGEVLVPSGSIDNFSTFIFEKAEFGNFTLSVGGRVDARSQKAKPNTALNLPDKSAGETDDVLDHHYFEFSGSLGGTYQFTENFAIAANAGRGFRAPSLFNLYVNGVHGGVAAFQVGDPNLNPERALNTDLSLRWRSSRIKAKLTGYRNFIQNYIYLVNTGEFSMGGDGPPILRTIQGDARLLGLDVSVEAQATNWLQLDGTFDFVKGKNVDNSIQNVDALPLLPSTKLKGGIKFAQPEIGSLQNPYLRVGIVHAFQKEAAGRYEPFYQFGPDFPFGRASTDAYTLLNASLGFDLGLWNRPVSFQITAHNLLNNAYRDFLDTYKGYALSPGRSIDLRVKIPFSIL